MRSASTYSVDRQNHTAELTTAIQLTCWIVPVFIIVVLVAALLMLEQLPSTPMLALYGGLAIALAVRYRFWSPLEFSGVSFYGHLFWLLFGALLALSLNLLVARGMAFYSLLVAAEGYIALSSYNQLYGQRWFVAVLVCTGCVYLIAHDLQATSAMLLQVAPLSVAVVAAAELLLMHLPPNLDAHEVCRSPEQYKEYINRIEALAIARERARIAHEFHDTLGHTLTALNVQIELLARLPAENISERQHAVGQARVLVKDGLGDVRRSILALHPAALESFSVVEAINSLISDFKKNTQATISWHIEGQPSPLSPDRSLLLYRTAQETLTNVRRHANATAVAVVLQFTPESVIFTVDNDGVHSQDSGFGFGLLGIDERTRDLHGHFSAGLEPPDHFHVNVELPC